MLSVLRIRRHLASRLQVGRLSLLDANVAGPILFRSHYTKMGDLNNTDAARKALQFDPDPAYEEYTLALTETEDNLEIRQKYRPFLLPPEVRQRDWISKLELSTAFKVVKQSLRESSNERLKVLVLYGSLRQRLAYLTNLYTLLHHVQISDIPRSYSKLLAYEASRILFRLGCDVRVFDPSGLPVKDDVQFDNQKVQELRELSKWSDGHVWICPEQHGNLVSTLT